MPPRLTSQDFDHDPPVRLAASVRGRMDRRSFLAGARKFAKAGVTAAGLLAALHPGFAPAQQVAPASPSTPARPVRMRGTILTVTPGELTLRTRAEETVTLALAPTLTVSEVYPISFADIRPGAFIGSGAMPQPDGAQRAIAVMLFPEALRGTGEGHYPFDLLPNSTMTNATVAEVIASGADRRLHVRYRGGEQTIVVPPDAPVVTFRAADRSLLVPGASIAASVVEVEGEPTAIRISAGRDGFAVPY